MQPSPSPAPQLGPSASSRSSSECSGSLTQRCSTSPSCSEISSCRHSSRPMHRASPSRSAGSLPTPVISSRPTWPCGTRSLPPFSWRSASGCCSAHGAPGTGDVALLDPRGLDLRRRSGGTATGVGQRAQRRTRIGLRLRADWSDGLAERAVIERREVRRHCLVGSRARVSGGPLTPLAVWAGFWLLARCCFSCRPTGSERRCPARSPLWPRGSPAGTPAF